MTKLSVVSVSVVILVLSLVGCQTPEKSTKAEEAPATKDANLTMAEASQRRDIQDIHYALNIHLDESTNEFFGTTEVQFSLPKSKPVFLDFKYGKVLSVKVNENVVPVAYDGFRIPLNGEWLQPGKNTVTIGFTQTYSKNGAGLYKFVDPVDKLVYLYTQFEPFDAHQMFPCFDQPDLKATLKLTVEAPPTWHVVSTTREQSAKTVNNKKVWAFEQTPRLSTYLFSLHAGPYQMWTSNYQDIPLRLFARKSMAKQVNPDEWFQPLKYGLQFFGDWFAFPYPFKKYDQLVVPDFNAGAMENVGAVTFSERYLRTGKKTKKEVDGLADTILHELAHMWFGDLVTMKWWNGLWLNESFATYISTYAMSKNKLYDDAWTTFSVSSKNWAYTEDEYITTHPIELVVPDTLNAFTNFDGITYGKGASVLKQLSYYVGEEKFRDGLRLYFKAHQYSNTDLSDFLGALAGVSGLDLASWGKIWLEEAGLDSVKVEFTCQQDRYKTFDLVQAPAPGSQKYRPHKTLVGLYDDRNGKMALRKKVVTSYQGSRTSVSELIGQDCAEFVYTNVDDHDYVKVELDANSLKNLGSYINRIDEPLTRAMVWLNLFQMLRDQKLKLAEYSKLATDSLKAENHIRVLDRIVETLLGYGKSGYQSARDYWPRTTDQERKARETWIGELESVLWSRVQRSAGGSDMQKWWFDTYVKAVETQSGVNRLSALIQGKTKLSGFNLDQDRRWEIVIKIAQMGAPNYENLVVAEERADRSEKGQKQAMAARAVFPSREQKVRWFNEVVTNKDMSLARIKTVLQSLNPHTEKEFKKYLNTEFYNRLPLVMRERDQEFLTEFVENLVPRGCDKQSTEKLSTFVDQRAANMAPVVSRPLRVTLQEETRCLKIREYSAKDNSVVKP